MVIDWIGRALLATYSSSMVLQSHGALRSNQSLLYLHVKLSTFAACQAIWLDNVMKELNCEVKKPLKLKIDNRSAINLAKNPIAHGRSKHIETRFHFIREQVSKGMIEVEYCPTEAQLADGFTKALKIDRFTCLRDKLGLIEC